ncbi:MAG: hypothetical protein QHH09_02510 [Microgenomates group bacterium]|nr:hypothetical protein [Microgenomates group bacterium]
MPLKKIRAKVLYRLLFYLIPVLILAFTSFFFILNALNNKNLVYKSKAIECENGQWRTECLSPRERQSCPSDAGVEQVFLCEGGQWAYKYPQCAVRCAPDSGSGPINSDPRCVGKTPGVTIDSCVRKDCDTNIKKLVCIETYCDNNLQFQEKPGRPTNETCGLDTAPCNKGAVIEYCARQECDVNLGVYVCIETYWNDNCTVSERVGTPTSTTCGDQFAITGQPNIAWPSITPGGGEVPIIISQPSPTLRPTKPAIPTTEPTPLIAKISPTPDNKWCLSYGQTGLVNGECYYCFSPYIPPVKTDLAKCAKTERIVSPVETGSVSPVPTAIVKINCDYSSLKECKSDCSPPNYCTTISNQCYKCYTAKQQADFIAQRLQIPTNNDEAKVFKKSEEGISKIDVSQESCTKNTCCGSTSICAGTGILRLGKAKCQPCGITSEICINGKCQRAGCTNYGETKMENNLCYSCFKPYSDKPGEFIAIDPKICQSGQKKVESGDIVTLAVHAEDQYHLRQEAYEKYTHDPNIGFGQKVSASLMRFGDGLGHAWGSVSAAISRTFGNKEAQATSSLGNYYVNNMKANIEYEKTHAGEKRKVTVGQALAGGVAGGLDFANKMTFGALNKVTFGGIAAADRGLMTAAFGKEEEGNYERIAAESARSAGIDLTNTVAILLPAAKGVGGIGNLTTKAGAKLVASNSKLIGGFGRGLEAGGKAISWAGKALEWTSPETWTAPFIKSAPISTAVEAGSKALAASKPFSMMGQRVGKTLDVVTNKIPVIEGVANGVKKVGQKAFEFIVPRSALTYTPEEAARFLARDIKIGLIDEAGAAERLISKYHISAGQIPDSSDFSNLLKQNLNAPVGKGYQILVPKKSIVVINTNKVADSVKREIERINRLSSRVVKIKEVGANNNISVDQTNLIAYSKKFSHIKNEDELAEAILHEWEKVDTISYIDNLDQLGKAKRYAQEVLELRKKNSLTNRIKTSFDHLKDQISTRLSEAKKETTAYVTTETKNGIRFGQSNNDAVLNVVDRQNIRVYIDGNEITGSQAFLKGGEKVVIKRVGKPDEEFIYKGMKSAPDGKQRILVEKAPTVKVVVRKNQVVIGTNLDNQFFDPNLGTDYAKLTTYSDGTISFSDFGNNPVLIFDTQVKAFNPISESSRLKAGDIIQLSGQQFVIGRSPGGAIYLIDIAKGSSKKIIASQGLTGQLKDLSIVFNERKYIENALNQAKAKVQLRTLTKDRIRNALRNVYTKYDMGRDENFFTPLTDTDVSFFEKKLAEIEGCLSPGCNRGLLSVFDNRSQRLFNKPLGQLTYEERIFLAARSLSVEGNIPQDVLQNIRKALIQKTEELNEIGARIARQNRQPFTPLDIDDVSPGYAGGKTMIFRYGNRGASYYGVNTGADEIVLNLDQLADKSENFIIATQTHETIHSAQRAFGFHNYDIARPTTYTEVFTEWLSNRLAPVSQKEAEEVAYYIGVRRLNDFISKHRINGEDLKRFIDTAVSCDFQQLDKWLTTNYKRNLRQILGDTTDYHFYHQIAK